LKGPADLSITKTATSPPAAARSASASVLPAGVTFVSATPTQGSCSGTTTSPASSVRSPTPGSASVVLKVIPISAGPLSNTAGVSAAPQSDPNPTNDQSTSLVTVAPASNIPALGAWAKNDARSDSRVPRLFMMKKE